MKKILILIIITLMLTGCKAIVNIDIDESTIKEKITANSNNEKEYSKIKNWNGFPLPLYSDTELDNPYSSNRKKESGVDYYNVYFDDNTKTVTGEATFSLENHLRSSLVKGCFKYYNITEDENNNNIKTFATSSGLICGYSNFEIVVFTPYKVLTNNATDYNKETNKFTWKITDRNKDKINIYFSIDYSQKYNEENTNVNESENETKENKENESENKNSNIYLLIGGIALFLIVVLLIVLKIKKNKASNI